MVRLGKQSVQHFAAFFLIGLLCCIHFDKLNYIVVINDEFGYWGTAVSIAGYDWKELLNETPYYSWGYSIWLIPIILLFRTPELWYKAAIVLNIVFLCVSYCFCYRVGRILFANVSSGLVAIVSLITIIYPANIVYAQEAWSETLSCMLMWGITYFIVRMDEKFSWKLFFGTIFLLGYMYVVHNRNIGIVAVGFLCLFAILHKHGKSLLWVALVAVFLGVCYFLYEGAKRLQVANLLGDSSISSINSVGLDWETISGYLLRLTDHIGLFMGSLGGKFIYLLIGTGLTLPIAIIQVVKDTVTGIRQKQIFQNHSIVKWWGILSLAAMWGICSLQMYNWDGRKDFIVYGRYMENAVGPVLFLGIMYAILSVKISRVGEIVSLAALLIGYRSVYHCVAWADGWFNSLCSPVVGAFWELGKNAKEAFLVMGLVAGGAFVVLIASSFIKKKEVRAGIIAVAFLLVFGVMGYTSAAYSNRVRGSVDEVTVNLREKLVREYPERELYFVKNVDIDLTSMKPKYFQFLVPDKPIHVIGREDIPKVAENDVIIMMDPADEGAIAEMENCDGANEISTSWLYKVYQVSN